ncbi:zinc metalloprotease HtpX [Maritalea porphyrae]|uniref:zinc metalloprotease HtpX n=1 Tax=Maritalea porphyrae TaxID=880732 RepID=UPI0022AF1FFB|nr:zinc metalloprotease HtpX [Maritalea porphyrae]MCZ4272408.1 zinc metalloprotease HtpX [Maritalea porphyrae]
MFNAIRTTFLLAVMTGLFMAVGFVVAGSFGMFFALALALITNLIAYWNSDKMVLRMQRARELGWRDSPDLFELVERLSLRAGIPMPKLYLMDNKQPNAFATGRNPENAAVAVSTGLLSHLEYDEIGAVIAHELAHIRSRDTLTMTVTATFAGAISMLAQFGLFFGARNTNSPLGPVASIVMIIVAPMAALMVQMAVSRTREYEADKDGAMICGDPLALARALGKISKLAKNFENPFARRSPGMAHLFIINPLAGRGADNMFSTHPNVENRIAALLELSKQMQVEERQQGEIGRVLHSPQSTRGGWRTPNSHVSDKNQPKGPWG